MNRLKKEEWEQVVGEFYRAVSVKSEKERNVKKNFLKKVIIGVKKITETGRDPNRNTIKYIDLDKLVETLTEICMQAQRNNKIREINWMRILLLIVEEKTGEDMLSRVIFPPADVDVDDPASRQEYIHERKVNFNLDKSQQPVIASKIAEELWCGTRTIESDLAAIKIFSGISTNIHIEMDINITQCADLIRGLFEQRSELMAKPSSDDIIQQIWHQLRPAIRKKIQSFFETLGEQDLLDYLKNLKNLEKTRKSEWDFLCEACLPVEGKSNWIRFPEDDIKNAYQRFFKIGLRNFRAHIQLKSNEILEGFIKEVTPNSFYLELTNGECIEIFIKEVSDFQLNENKKSRN
ncbi:MAG: hypothetical protein ACOX4A_00200 [Saccharofermentanales bacterium]|jgi:hypothetical protein